MNANILELISIKFELDWGQLFIDTTTEPPPLTPQLRPSNFLKYSKRFGATHYL